MVGSVSGASRNPQFRPLKKNPTNDPVIDSPLSYQIKPGDNLTKLAKQWGVKVDDIVKANAGTVSDPNKINAGAFLSVPQAKSQVRPLKDNPTNDPVIDSPLSYQIKKGDTLGELAKKWGVKVDDIVKANAGTVSDPNKISENAFLSVPHPGSSANPPENSQLRPLKEEPVEEPTNSQLRPLKEDTPEESKNSQLRPLKEEPAPDNPFDNHPI